MIAVPITASTTRGAIKDMREAYALADLIELRLDFIKDINKNKLKKLLQNKRKKIIVTDRKKRLSMGLYMIMVNLGMVMNECLSTNKYDQIIKESANTVLNKFWNKKYKILFENINTDYTFDLKSCDGRHIIPGHGLEAMWFILEYTSKNNNKNMVRKASGIIKALLKFGWDKKNGGIFYFRQCHDG